MGPSAGNLLRSGVQRPKHAPVGARGKPGRALEHPPKKRRVFITDQRSNFVRRTVPGLQQTFGFLDAEVLNVGDQRRSRGDLKTAFEAAFRYPTLSHHSRNGMRLPVMRGKPAFSLSHDGIRVRLPAYETGVRKLPFPVPLEQVASPGLQWREMM